MQKLSVYNINHKTKVEMIIQQIKQRRELLQYNQADVAKRLNMSVNSYSKIERGLTHLDLPKLFKLAEILETDIKALM